jgi:serine/threonine protein phosphatase 1
MGRTIAVGDIHGDLDALGRLLAKLPELDAGDALVFLGDYVDRGPRSAEVVARLMELPQRTRAKVVCLRGNHEDAWLQVIDAGWTDFVVPRTNGCLETLRSFKGLPSPAEDEEVTIEELKELAAARFFPDHVIAWMRQLPFFYEDEHAIYVHAGMPRRRSPDGAPHADLGFAHPSEVEPKRTLLWLRDRDFFANYRGKLVVFGHTTTKQLPPDLSSYTPEDPADLWAGPAVAGLDTGAGKGGFLTAVELPRRWVYESR